jgi:hypothetical protein
MSVFCMRASALTIMLCVAWPGAAHGQELEARGFSRAPVGTSFVVAGFGASDGAIVLDPAAPIDGVEADLQFALVGGGYTFDLFGHQARVLGVLPYAWGEISGEAGGASVIEPLDGFADPSLKLSVGLIGAPALTREAFAQAPRGTVVAASFTVMPPLGQYDAESVVNVGYNRWAFKPEIGVSQPIGPWTLEASTGVWLYTDNDDYYPGGATRHQDAIYTLQAHANYTFTNGSWIAADAAWFSGGRTALDGVANEDRQSNARYGVTYSHPIARDQSLKFTYSFGATTRRGTDFDTFNITWHRVMF